MGVAGIRQLAQFKEESGKLKPKIMLHGLRAVRHRPESRNVIQAPVKLERKRSLPERYSCHATADSTGEYPI